MCTKGKAGAWLSFQWHKHTCPLSQVKHHDEENTTDKGKDDDKADVNANKIDTEYLAEDESKSSNEEEEGKKGATDEGEEEEDNKDDANADQI